MTKRSNFPFGLLSHEASEIAAEEGGIQERLAELQRRLGAGRTVNRAAPRFDKIAFLTYKQELFRQMDSQDEEPRLIPFILYLGDENVSEDEAERIDAALSKLVMQLFNCYLIDAHEPIVGSWWATRWLKTFVPLSKDDLSKLNATAQRAFELKSVEAQEADQTLTYANALGVMNKMFENEGEVNCLIGNILYIKTEREGSLKTVAISLTEKNIKMIMNNPNIMKQDHNAIVEFLRDDREEAHRNVAIKN